MVNQNKSLNDEITLDADDLDLNGDSRGEIDFSNQEDGLFNSLNTDKSDDDNNSDNTVSISKSKLALMKIMAENIKESNDQLLRMLSNYILEEDELRIRIGQGNEQDINSAIEKEVDGKVIEGVFDGQNMIGPDGKQYSVPVNYASKSKLVEGDILKLTITHNGTFVYKQIGPIERGRVVGTLQKGPDGTFIVDSGDKQWRTLTASVTFFKGEVGDEVVLLIPLSGDSQWGAVENVIRKVN